MLSPKMKQLGAKRSVIRELFEYGNQRKAQIGAENVFDYSLGNPSVPSPDCVTEGLKELVQNVPPQKLHAYTSAPGDAGVRRAIADHLNQTYQAGVSEDLLYMTVGAAASLTISLSATVQPGEEVIVLAPYFPEYHVFIAQCGGVPVDVPCTLPDFQPDTQAISNAITPKTAAIIINSPNNPSGAVFSEESIQSLCRVLTEKEKEYGHPIYLISDEPYRELVYGNVQVPFLTRYYDDVLICYSFSKSLSLPGERIGYIAVSPKCRDCRDVYFAVCGAGRSLGFVCAPSLFQYLIPKCLGQTADLSVYQTNRDLLVNALTEYGFDLVHPDGAFYLFVKCPTEIAAEFCEKAKDYELLLVASDDFGMPGYCRISYCVATDMIRRSLPSFEKLAKDFGLQK